MMNAHVVDYCRYQYILRELAGAWMSYAFWRQWHKDELARSCK